MLGKRLIWLRERLARTSSPQSIVCELVGTYNLTSRAVLIALCITVNGTEFRVIRYNKTVHTDKPESLRDNHKNMISYMVETYQSCDWKILARKFTQWTPNPTYKQIMQELISSS